MTIALYQQLIEALTKGPVVVATVIQTQGSVPREVGAKMLIAAGGWTFGTIGGGAGEAKVIQHAIEVMQTGQKHWLDIDLSGAPQRDTQGICGGTMRIWLERWQADESLALAHNILNTLQIGQPVRVVMPFHPAKSSYLADATIAPDAFPDAFSEVIEPPPMLLIIGAGHVGEQLAKVAQLIGFQIAVQDDRPDWANADRYPQTQVFSDLEPAIAQFATHPHLYAALVTRGYQYDLAALVLLLNRNPACDYIGMIGSQKRVRQVCQTLIQQGISPETLRSLYAPIGLDIGALTPEEIAISISAELIRVRRGGTGRSLQQCVDRPELRQTK